jgi:FkbM family methyltransferase
MSTIRKAMKEYGLQGLFVYLQLKTKNTESIRLTGFKNEIHLRKETADIKLFKQLLIHKEYNFESSVKPEFIIDAGANIGLSALFFVKAYPDAQIAAIEAEKDNFELLRRNTRNYANIYPINAGLWFKSTTLEVTDENVGSTGFMVRETNPANPKGFRALTTQDILKMHNKSHIDIFKIDIEGAEKEILMENTSWIDKTRILIIELHDRKKPGCSQAFFQAFSNRNFECHPFGQNFLLFNKDLI